MTPVELAPARRRAHWYERTRVRRAFDGVLAGFLALFVVLWAWAVIDAVVRGERPGIAASIAANPLDPTSPPEAVVLLDAALRAVARQTVEPALGESGAVRVVVAEPGDSVALALPDSLPAGVDVQYRAATGDTAVRDTAAVPQEPGIWDLIVSARDAMRTGGLRAAVVTARLGARSRRGSMTISGR